MAVLAPSLVALRNEINARYPNRDKSSDGWIGDAAHASRQSDHNPDARGIVHALDIDEDLDGNPADAGAELQWLVDHLVAKRDRRVSYIIYEGRMWRSYAKPGIPAWTPAKYTGANPHTKHVHISILSTPEAEQDTSPWLPNGGDDMGAAELKLLREIRADQVAHIEMDRRVTKHIRDEVLPLVKHIRSVVEDNDRTQLNVIAGVDAALSPGRPSGGHARQGVRQLGGMSIDDSGLPAMVARVEQLLAGFVTDAPPAE